jgi:L-malate glycosyltransferase
MFDNASRLSAPLNDEEQLRDRPAARRSRLSGQERAVDRVLTADETQTITPPAAQTRRLRSRRSTILFQWNQFAPYQIDRLEAVAAASVTDLEIVGVAVASRSFTYPWQPLSSNRVKTYDLFDDRKFEETTTWQRLWRRLADLRKHKVRYAFLCNYDQIDTLVVAFVLRVLGAKVFSMIESKFDDKPRKAWRELLKSFFLLPYHGAMVSGLRIRDYAAFLGVPPHRLFDGYDTVSVDRIRADGGAPVAPDGVPFADRHFTVVARHVEKKNLFMAIEAYERYRQLATSPRALHLCGTGELEDALKADVARRGLVGVEFRGFLEPEVVAKEFATTLALILPSKEEQWGLVVNEALAMGLPILCSDNVGARDSLVRTAVNGYVFEPDNPQGLALIMDRLAADEAEWRRLAKSATEFAYRGDSSHFASGVAQALAN